MKNNWNPLRKKGSDTKGQSDASHAPKHMVFELCWGGYYSTKNEDGSYGVWRLVDFNKDAVHKQLFQEKFDHRPTADEVLALKPFILHVPIAAASLFNEVDVQLVTAKPLTEQDLAGLAEYLKQALGAPEDYIQQLEQKLIGFSRDQPPAKLPLLENGPGIAIGEPGGHIES